MQEGNDVSFILLSHPSFSEEHHGFSLEQCSEIPRNDVGHNGSTRDYKSKQQEKWDTIADMTSRDPIHSQMEAFSLRIDRLDERLTQRLDRIAENIEAMTVQIGSFSEGLARLEHQVDRIATATEQQAEIAKTQAENIRQQTDTVNRLTRLVEQLIATP